MAPTPEEEAREIIDAALAAAGWVVQDVKDLNLDAGVGVAVREFPLAPGHGHADYLLYVGGKAAGIIEAKKAGVPLTGVEAQLDLGGGGNVVDASTPARTSYASSTAASSDKAPSRSSRGGTLQSP